MSYLQEAQIPAARVGVTARHFWAAPGRVALPLLLVLAFFHGALYAVFLPPWGLIDEAQHLHYIQYVVEEQKLPVVGDLYLSDEIVASLFATRRWDTFHWTPPPAPDPMVMGLEGHSYEAYQPPLFYLFMTPAYLALPDDMLVKVYGLRGVALLLSLVTVWATYHSARVLLPQFPRLPFWATLLLVAIPERAIATSRINNDVLLEVVAALFFVAITHALVSGLTMRRSALLGVLLGLGVWTKISAGVLGVPLLMLFWLRRHDRVMALSFAALALAAAPFGVGMIARNLWLYGDLTGFSSFDQLHRLAPTDLSLAGIARTLLTIPNHFWLVWWKGSEVGQNALLLAFYWLMAGVVVVAWARLAWAIRRKEVSSERRDAILVYALTVLLYALAVLGSYYEGMVPIIQGRFLLPAVVPVTLLIVWGLWLLPQGERILFAAVVALLGMGILSLFGNLVPYYYYWSEVRLGGMPPMAEIRGGELVALIYQRALLDKPDLLAPLLVILPVLYLVVLLPVLFVALNSLSRPSTTLPEQQNV